MAATTKRQGGKRMHVVRVWNEPRDGALPSRSAGRRHRSLRRSSIMFRLPQPLPPNSFATDKLRAAYEHCINLQNWGPYSDGPSINPFERPMSPVVVAPVLGLFLSCSQSATSRVQRIPYHALSLHRCSLWWQRIYPTRHSGEDEIELCKLESAATTGS